MNRTPASEVGGESVATVAPANDVRKPFLDILKSEMSRQFPKENTSVATSFQVLGLRSLSFLSPNEREDKSIVLKT